MEKDTDKTMNIYSVMQIARLISNLKNGEENAMFQRDLARMQGVTVRQYQEILNEACKLGFYQICTTNKGVFLAETDEEIAKSFKRKNNVAMDILVRQKATRQYLKKRGLL